MAHFMNRTVQTMISCLPEREAEHDQVSISALTLHTPVLPQLPARIRRLVNATCAAHGGAERMTLDEWRDLEQELKRKLENEHQ